TTMPRPPEDHPEPQPCLPPECVVERSAYQLVKFDPEEAWASGEPAETLAAEKQPEHVHTEDSATTLEPTCLNAKTAPPFEYSYREQAAAPPRPQPSAPQPERAPEAAPATARQ